MCILFFSFSDDPSQPYKLVLTSNRDEFYARPTKPAHFWDDNDIIAGMPISLHGTAEDLQRSKHTAGLLRDGLGARKIGWNLVGDDEDRASCCSY